jgi:hypothetical protein
MRITMPMLRERAWLVAQTPTDPSVRLHLPKMVRATVSNSIPQYLWVAETFYCFVGILEMRSRARYM